MATGADKGPTERQKLNKVFGIKRQINKELDSLQKSMMFSNQRIDHLTRMLHFMNDELTEEQSNLSRMQDEFDRITRNAIKDGFTG